MATRDAAVDGFAGSGLMVESQSGNFRSLRGEFFPSAAALHAIQDAWRVSRSVEYVGPVRRIGGKVERMRATMLIKQIEKSALTATRVDLVSTGPPEPVTAGE